MSHPGPRACAQHYSLPNPSVYLQVSYFTFLISDDESDDDFLQLKRKNHDLDVQIPSIRDADALGAKKFQKPTTRAALAKKMLKKKILPNKKVVFDEEGEVSWSNFVFSKFIKILRILGKL